METPKHALMIESGPDFKEMRKSLVPDPDSNKPRANVNFKLSLNRGAITGYVSSMVQTECATEYLFSGIFRLNDEGEPEEYDGVYDISACKGYIWTRNGFEAAPAATNPEIASAGNSDQPADSEPTGNQDQPKATRAITVIKVTYTGSTLAAATGVMLAAHRGEIEPDVATAIHAALLARYAREQDALRMLDLFGYLSLFPL